MTAEGVGKAKVTLEAKEDKQKATVNVTVTEGTAELDGTIVDSNQQYTTEDKYDTVSKMEKVVSGELSAWKNDTAVSQISLFTKDARVKNVSISVSDFTSKNGQKINRKNVETTFIKSVQAYTGMDGYGRDTTVLFQQETVKKQARFFISQLRLQCRLKHYRIFGYL